MFRIALVLGAAGVLMSLTFSLAQWRTDKTTLPRFCSDPDAALRHLRLILEDPVPAGEEERRPFIIAAKLLYLVPQRDDEPVEVWLERVRYEIARSCGS